MDDDPPITREAYLHAMRDMANLPPEPRAPAETPAAGEERQQTQQARSTAPSTSSVLMAEWRRGLKDLQTAVLGDWAGTHEEPGTIANPVPQEVYQDRHHATPAQETDSYAPGTANPARQPKPRDRSRTR